MLSLPKVGQDLTKAVAEVLKNLEARDLESYLKNLQLSGIDPNFWTSQEYFEKAGWAEQNSQEGKLIRIVDPYGYDMLPVIDTEISGVLYIQCWSDFNGMLNKPIQNLKPFFLDYEYIFKAANFMDMSGGKWSLFRKNSRKWPNRIGQGYIYKPIDEDSQIQLNDVVVSWLQSLGELETVHDDEVMLKYVFEGENRMGLFTEDGVLRAINIWDSNWKYTNYRYCICRKEPFLSDFARLLFYQDMYRRNPECLVNDGGVLDKISLKDFKDHMNPISVRKVYSWEEWQK